MKKNKKRFNEMSVYHGYYSWWWIPNWFKNIAVFVRNLRRAHHRALYGFCRYDTIDFEDWYVKLTMDALADFNGHEKYRDLGDYATIQAEIIDKIMLNLKRYRAATGRATDEEYLEVEPEYRSLDFSTKSTAEDRRRIWGENEEIRKRGLAALKEAYHLMGDHLAEFWD